MWWCVCYGVFQKSLQVSVVFPVECELQTITASVWESTWEGKEGEVCTGLTTHGFEVLFILPRRHCRPVLVTELHSR